TVSAESASGGKRINIVVYAAMFSNQGKILDSSTLKVDQTFKDDVFAQISKQGMLLHMDLDPKPSADNLRLAVRDNKTGYVGTLIVPLKP
ncbi:MAG TPA: hypothetical protein VLX11_03160, partial [Candidatus Acidoferrales bacterium]|nr:hypothetical protein [Candidatus Acidoferrales bacterium]